MGQLFSDVPGEPLNIEEELENLTPITHRLMCQFEVVPYGVLGARESSSSKDMLKPGTPIDAVVVDSAFAGQIATRNEPGGAMHGRAAIYKWVGIHKQDGRFPNEVHGYFEASRDEDAEGLARYHKYGPGQHVIHAVGPVLKEVEQSVHGLTQTYSNLLKEFCKARAAPPTTETCHAGASFAIGSDSNGVPRTLRLLPISTDGLVKNKHLAKHVARIFWSALAMALELLPVEMQRCLQDSRVEVCIFRDQQVRAFADALAEKKRAAEQALCLGPDMGAVPKMSGNYDWIRRRNGDVQRIARLAAASKTFQAIWDQKYKLPDGRVVELKHVDKLLAGTCVRRASEQNDACKSTNANGRTTKVTTASINTTPVMDLAVNLVRERRKVAAVNAASAHQIGGGVLTGGRHALEEAWCMTSTLLKSLQEAKFRTAEQFKLEAGYIPEDGAVLSPLVEVFRSGTSDGYAFLQEPAVLAGVVSVAMYNCNSKVKDSPVDAPEALEAYENGVRQKFRAMLVAAAESGADVLICPDVGCGVFENDATKVGCLLGEVLLEKNIAGLLEEIVVTGNRTFTQAVTKAVNREEVPCTWVPPSMAQRAAEAAADAVRRAASGAARAEQAKAFEPPPRKLGLLQRLMG